MSAEEANEATRRLDAREIDGEPFGPITAAFSELDDDESLLPVNSFEPVSLSDVLDERGFAHETEQGFTHETERAAPDEWHVRVEREG